MVVKRLVLLIVVTSALTAGASSQEGAVDLEKSSSVALEDPTLEDTAPTLELTAPPSEVSVAPAAEGERCAVEIGSPAEGLSAEPETEQPRCVDLQDATPMMMTPDGLIELGEPSTEEILVERLGERREQLDLQAKELEERSALIDAAEKRLNERVEELSRIESNIADMVTQQDEEDERQIAELADLYATMKPREAAEILNGLSDAILLKIASAMPPRRLAPILAQMEPMKARALTVLLARPATSP